MKKMIYAAIATALVSYLMKKFMGKNAMGEENHNPSGSNSHHLTDVFSKAKNYANS